MTRNGIGRASARTFSTTAPFFSPAHHVSNNNSSTLRPPSYVITNLHYCTNSNHEARTSRDGGLCLTTAQAEQEETHGKCGDLWWIVSTPPLRSGLVLPRIPRAPTTTRLAIMMIRTRDLIMVWSNEQVVVVRFVRPEYNTIFLPPTLCPHERTIYILRREDGGSQKTIDQLHITCTTLLNNQKTSNLTITRACVLLPAGTSSASYRYTGRPRR